MQNILDCTPIAQFAIDRDHRVTHWNRAMVDLTGVGAKEIIGTRDAWKVFYPKKRPVLADLIVNHNPEELERLYKDLNITKSEIIPLAWEATDFFKNIGGFGKHLYFLAAPILDEEGKIVGAIETVQDITQRVVAECDLKESQERYQVLTEQVADGVALLRDGELAFVNKAFAAIFGYSDGSDLLGIPAIDLIADSDKELYNNMVHDFRIGGFAGKILELRCIRPNGDTFWIEAHNNPITWEGQPALLTTVRDISHRKYRELAEREEARSLRDENERLKYQLKNRFGLDEMVGRSQPMQTVYDSIVKAASSNANIIIYGESGTGKELVARAIHAMSDRSDKEFIAVNCGAIPENLFESEFFGHKKGAFTGAAIEKIGFLESARGGYLLLDEVGEIPLNMQVKLLRVIDGGDFTPIGSTRAKKFDARIIAATNRNLSELVRDGRMREDFFYRIHILPIQVPPLRERMEDLPLLIYHFLETFGHRMEDAVFPEHVLKAMMAYDWPGNVRELRNAVHRYMTLKTIDFLNPSRGISPVGRPVGEPAAPEIGPGFDLRRVLENFEKQVILKALRSEKGNRTRAAQALGTQRRSLQRKLIKYRIAEHTAA